MNNYSPAKNQFRPVADLYKNFFTVDLLDPEFYSVFKKDLFDFFIDNPQEKNKYPAFWLLNVFGTWKFFGRLESGEILDAVPGQILTATSLGYNVFDIFIRYLDSVRLPSRELIQAFYGEFRNRFLDSNEKIKKGNTELNMKQLIREVTFLQSKGGNDPEFLELKKELAELLFSETEKSPIGEYLTIDRRDALAGLISLINLFNNITQEQITRRLNELLFQKGEGVKLENINLKRVEPTKIKPPALETKPKEIIKKEEIKKPIEKPIEKTEPAPMPAPTYTDIKSKILQFFPKDENGEIIDTEGVFEVLEKTAEKYQDEKIKEIYYYNENTGKFEWGV